MTNLEESMVFSDDAGNRISGILATPAGGTDRVAVLCHGFLSTKNSATNKALTAMLLPQGIATFRFDFFGHGESDGLFERLTVGTAVQQTREALAFVASRGYRKIGLVGSSFGGLVAILAAAGYGEVACLALKCPVSDFPEMLREEFGPQGMREWQATNTIPNVTGGQGRIRLAFSFYEDCTHHLAYRAAKAIAAPTLIVHGEADEYVPVAQSLRLQESLAGKTTCVVLPGADHHFSQPAHFREMITHIGGWIGNYLAA
jgi:pimeloyl-ACP methyl ester carboxylesterase